MLFDTSFFIHLSGRGGRRSRSAALAFLAAHPDLPLYTSRVSWAELAEGVTSPTVANDLLSDYSIIEIDEDVAWQTSRVARLLKRTGPHIGDNDCWIAGTALAKGLALVTRNVKHFERVPGLGCAQYWASRISLISHRSRSGPSRSFPRPRAGDSLRKRRPGA